MTATRTTVDTLHPTAHLLDVMARRRISWAEVVEVVEAPEVVYPSVRRGVTYAVHRRGSLAVVLAPSGAAVTVLLSSSTAWTDTDAATRRAAS